MRRLRILTVLVVVALLGAGCGGGGSSKPQLVVSAAASLQTAFTQYGQAFTEADAKFSFAGSDVLAAQIRKGVKPDVFASANAALPEALYRAGLVEKPILFTTNTLVLATRADDTKIESIGDVEKKGVRLAIGTPTVPVGAYTTSVLAHLPAAQRAAILANVRTREPDVSGIVGKLTQGAVDAGFMYTTDVRATNGKLQGIALPAAMQPDVAYGVAVVKGAHQPLAAKAFVYGLLSGAGRNALDRGGFGAAPTP
jgi:molybdate transport system substrate-binding protein